MKFRPCWYDLEEVKWRDEEIIEGDTMEECIAKAYKLHNGRPPAPTLYLEPVKE